MALSDLPTFPSMKDDFRLPVLQFDDSGLESDVALSLESHIFSAKTLARALVNRCSTLKIKEYLQTVTPSRVSKTLEHLVKHHRVITYAIDSDSVETVRLLLEYDVNVNALDFGHIPLLGFAIMRAVRTGYVNVEIIKMLLAQGANPKSVPKDMWQDFIKTPRATRPDLLSTEHDSWCITQFRTILSKTLNLTVRYCLWQANRFHAPSRRLLQMAKGHKINPLLKLPFQIIGQELGTQLVMENLFGHIALNTTSPFVLAFAGLSGHGKTELATQMGKLLSAKMISLDCAQMTTVEALLGSPSGYHGNSDGAPLNNYLVENQGKRCVVFLDEFDKTTANVRNALLKVMDDGTYRDRRSDRDSGEIECSRVIWILATNLGDHIIGHFYEEQLADLAGRINAIVPFFQFSSKEQAVVAHKFLMDMQNDARQDIDIEEPRCVFVGHVNIRVLEDGKVCQHIADNGYHKDLGARSIRNAVNNVRRHFALVYAASDELVEDDMNKGEMHEYVVQLNPVSETESEISVTHDKVANVVGNLAISED
ncbi:P-loop containing nucleoside triphosphate hydrolase protein, partial [Truncatella angustata]